jgi:hypothetical protein
MPFIAVAGIMVAAWVAIHNRRKTRVQAQKDKFGVFIREQIAAVPRKGVSDFYSRTKPELRSAVQTVGHFLDQKQRATLDRLWREYDEIPWHDLRQENEASWLADFHKRFGGEYQHPQEIVRYYLDQFYEFAA